MKKHSNAAPIQYQVNKPDVVAEVIDAELVAIHLGTGCYYHANKSGSFIWSNLEEGESVATVSAAFAHRYGLSPVKAEPLVAAFTKKLAKEKLIRPTSGLKTKGTKTKKSSVDTKTASTAEKFEEPSLQKHVDMKELLLLDPIHDVGEESWPLTAV